MIPLPQENEDLIHIARIARPQGNRGEVIADLLTDFPDRFESLDEALVKRASGEIVTLPLESARLYKGRVVLKFAGYDDINTAERLRDSQVCVTREQLVKLPEDTWFNFDLVDCAVSTRDGAMLGRVTGVEQYGAAPLLAVKGEDGRELLIPFALSICVEIDPANKRIVVDPPEGLLDL
ncbi:MAG: ribosome maturation factor RimM [Blastocatellia bacterium]